MTSGCNNKGIKGLEIVSKIELQRLNFVFLKELLTNQNQFFNLAPQKVSFFSLIENMILQLIE